jgi:hypothetical protein
MKEMKVLSRAHFFDLLDGGQEEFRIETTTPGKNKRVISEDAPSDKDDPMSYVLVNTIFDQITIFAKGDFSAHDVAEAERVYGGPAAEKSLQEQINDLNKTVTELRKQLVAA